MEKSGKNNVIWVYNTIYKPYTMFSNLKIALNSVLWLYYGQIKILSNYLQYSSANTYNHK